MKLFKKIIAATLALMMVLGISTTAYAVVSTGHLEKDQTEAYTSDVFGTHKYYSGSNSFDSDGKVYYIVRYKSGAVWYVDDKILLARGEPVPETRTRKFETKKYWHVKLNPKGASATGCEAWAFIWNA